VRGIGRQFGRQAAGVWGGAAFSSTHGTDIMFLVEAVIGSPSGDTFGRRRGKPNPSTLPGGLIPWRRQDGQRRLRRRDHRFGSGVSGGHLPPRPWPADGGALCRQAMAEGIDASGRMNCSRGWIPTVWFMTLSNCPLRCPDWRAAQCLGALGNSSGQPRIGNRPGSIFTRHRGPWC
jgi:hypothetical protein